MTNENNTERRNENNNNNKRVTMVIILVTINRKVKLKFIKQWLSKFVIHKSNLEKQAVPMIHKVQYIGRIKSTNCNIIKW